MCADASAADLVGAVSEDIDSYGGDWCTLHMLWNKGNTEKIVHRLLCFGLADMYGHTGGTTRRID